MKNTLLSVLTAFAFAIVSTLTASAFDVSLVGSGTTAQASKKSLFGTELRLESFVTQNVSVGLNQGISYTGSTRGSSELFGAYNVNYNLFKVKNQAFLGGGGRISYGDDAPQWTAGPLVGNRIFLRKDVYILTQVSYDVGLNRHADNGLRYLLGLGVRF